MEPPVFELKTHLAAPEISQAPHELGSFFYEQLKDSIGGENLQITPEELVARARRDKRFRQDPLLKNGVALTVAKLSFVKFVRFPILSPKERVTDQLSDRFQFEDIYYPLHTIEVERTKVHDDLSFLRSELKTHRFFDGHKMSYDPIFDVLRLDYEQWLNENSPVLFPTLSNAYKIDWKMKADTPHSFWIDAFGDVRILSYRPELHFHVQDEEETLTIAFTLDACAKFSEEMERIQASYLLVVGDFLSPIDYCNSRHVKILDQFICDLSQWRAAVQKINLQRRRTVLIKMSRLNFKEEDLPRKKSGRISPRLAKKILGSHPKKKSSHYQPVKTNSQPTLRKKTSLGRVFAVSESQQDAQALSHPLTVSHSDDQRLKKKSALTASERNPEDVEWAVKAILPEIVRAFDREEAVIHKIMCAKLQEYLQARSLPRYAPLIDKGVETAKENADLARMVKWVEEQFEYFDTDDHHLVRICQLHPPELWDHPDFTQVLTSPTTKKNFLDRVVSESCQLDEQQRLLKQIFSKIYTSGYPDPVLKQLNKTDLNAEEIDMLAELQTLRFIKKQYDPIQYFVYPVILPMKMATARYEELFPHINQIFKTHSYETDSSDAAHDVEKYSVSSRFSTLLPQIRIIWKWDHFDIVKSTNTSLILKGEKKAFGELTLEETLVGTKTDWFRVIRITQIEFFRNTDINLVRYVVEKLFESGSLRQGKDAH